MIDYDEWLIANEEELIIKYAETGEDREFDFDLEHSLERDYQKYCRRNND
jgi:hypothetical protein